MKMVTFVDIPRMNIQNEKFDLRNYIKRALL